jgi:hypothetical protein
MAPEKAEAFGSAIAFALDDALLKSKSIALIRSGNLQSGSKAMLGEINRRQNAASAIKSLTNSEIKNKRQEEGIPGYAKAVMLIPVIGALLTGVFERVYIEANRTEEASKALGSTIQTLKELNNAESLLNEERSKGIITNAQFTTSLNEINRMRDKEYNRVKTTVDIGADTGSQAQAIKDQLVLSGFTGDTAQAVASNSTSESIAKALGFDPSNLDKNQEEVVKGVIAATLDGITESNAAEKIANIKDVYANKGDELLKAAEDGLSASDIGSIDRQSQIEKFVSSTADGAFMSYDTEAVAANAETALTNSGSDPTKTITALSEFVDKDLALDILQSVDSLKKLNDVMNDLPENMNLEMTMKYFFGQSEITDPSKFVKKQQEVIDKIQEIAPPGSDAATIFLNLQMAEVNMEDMEAKVLEASAQVSDIMNQISGLEGDDLTLKLNAIFNVQGNKEMEAAMAEFAKLPPDQQKTFLTSFITATGTVDLGAKMPEMGKEQSQEEYQKTLDSWNAGQKNAAQKFLDSFKSFKTGLGQAQSTFDDPSDGPGGGSSRPSAKDKEADRLKKLNDLLRERFELQQMAIDKDTEVYNNSIDKLNRQIELEERQVKLRQRGLEELSKKEEAVNDAYNLRVEALDKVSESNSRIGEQERSRISLASALASGDIAAAANITSEMQQQSAQYQIEDARAALEKQRQIDLDALTVSINGKLMTRKGIEFEIEQIQDRIYNKGIEIQGLQDKLRILEDQRLVIAKEREKVETRTFLIAQRKAILDLTGKNGKIPKENQQAYKDFVSSFNRIADMYNQANPGAKVGKLNYGGSIAKMANGGITYKGSTEPPPPIMMNDGFTVPGNGMTDKVSALLTPGEFVVRKSVADKNRGFLQALNGQVFPGVGGKQGVPTNNFLDGIGSPRYSIPSSGVSNIPVANTNVVSTSSPMYNSTYNVNVNVSGTNASPDDIANVVMSKLSNQNRGNLRSSRY